MSRTTRRAVLALGSNLGDRLAMLQGAVDALGRVTRLVADVADLGGAVVADGVVVVADIAVVAVSPVFETDPVGGPRQDDFLNAVVIVETNLDARELLDLAHHVEDRHGRVRGQRWGPRTLDVDIITVGDERVDEPDIVVPHPRAVERAFVLLPWSSVDSAAVLPGSGRVADLLRGLDTSGVRPRHDLPLRMPAGMSS